MARGISAPGKDNVALAVSATGRTISQPGSGRASPSLGSSTRSIRQPTPGYAGSIAPMRTGSSSGAIPHSIKSLDSFNSKNVAAALLGSSGEVKQIDDVWQNVCVRLLPLL